MRWAPPFSPRVVFLYNAGTAIGYAEAVQWNSGTAVEFSDPEYAGEVKKEYANQSTRSVGTTITVPTIKQATTIATNNSFCGVAMEDISANSWGRVAMSGLVDVLITTTENITVGDLLVASAAGMFAEHPGIATGTQVHAIAMEACLTSGTCVGAYIHAFIPESIIPGDWCAGGATTA